MSLTTSQLEEFVVDLVNDRARWQHLVRHDGDGRVFAQVWEDEDVNAWVICWSEDQDTGFHDHDESTAAIAIMSGEVREDRLRLTASPTSRRARAGSVFTVPASAVLVITMCAGWQVMLAFADPDPSLVVVTLATLL